MLENRNNAVISQVFPFFCFSEIKLIYEIYAGRKLVFRVIKLYWRGKRNSYSFGTGIKDIAAYFRCNL